MHLTRSSLAIALVAPAFVCGCFALFSLDDYGPNRGGGGDGGDADASVDAGSGDATPDAKLPSRIVFVTSERYLGSMGGLAGADNRCNALAADAGLAGSFVAWLGAGTTSAASRIPVPARDIVLANDEPVALDLGALGASGPQTRILLTEKKQPVAVVPCDVDHVWTNAAGDGALPDGGLDCDGWSGVTGGGTAGRLGAGREWSDGCAARGCDSMGRLYCFQK